MEHIQKFTFCPKMISSNRLLLCEVVRKMVQDIATVSWTHMIDFDFSAVACPIMAAITMALTQDMGSFPMVYRRKNLFSHSMGIIPEVFVDKLHGNVAQIQWEHFPLLTHLKLY